MECNKFGRFTFSLRKGTTMVKDVFGVNSFLEKRFIRLNP